MKKVALCESCAEERGVTDPEGLLMADQLLGNNAPLQEVAETLKIDQEGECPACGFRTEDYQKVGRLGCSECYGAFYEGIAGRLPTLHKGLKHEGRVPEGLLEVEKRRAELESLTEDLEKAIQEEDYEQAAILRDQIQNLEAQSGKETAQS